MLIRESLSVYKKEDSGQFLRINVLAIRNYWQKQTYHRCTTDDYRTLLSSCIRLSINYCHRVGPLLANAFMCSIEETLEREGKMPTYYKRFVDDTLTIMPNKTSADNFLDILNQCHSPIKFTMETESNSMLSFLGTQLLNKHTRVETKVYVKPTNTGLLLYYKSHVDDRYKRGLLKTMLDRAYRLSSNWHYFSEECYRLKLVFSRLKYPDNLVNSTISRFVAARASDQPVSSPAVSDRLDPIRVVLPFKDQA